MRVLDLVRACRLCACRTPRSTRGPGPKPPCVSTRAGCVAAPSHVNASPHPPPPPPPTQHPSSSLRRSTRPRTPLAPGCAGPPSAAAADVQRDHRQAHRAGAGGATPVLPPHRHAAAPQHHQQPGPQRAPPRPARGATRVRGGAIAAAGAPHGQHPQLRCADQPVRSPAAATAPARALAPASAQRALPVGWGGVGGREGGLHRCSLLSGRRVRGCVVCCRCATPPTHTLAISASTSRVSVTPPLHMRPLVLR